MPRSLRNASFGVGATKWQTIWSHVLPNALPGILTGTILAISRAIGETAPLVVVGASTAINFDPTSTFSKFTTLPIQIYQWTSRPQDEFRALAAAAIHCALDHTAHLECLRDPVTQPLQQEILNMTTDIQPDNHYILETHDLDIFYGSFKAVTGVNMKIEPNKITAIIGPSGCGKSTLLRSFNRMNELYAGTSIKGQILFNGEDIYARDVDPVEVRYRIGMVFQKPNPFPKSIYDNIAWTARIHGFKGNMDELVEKRSETGSSLG